MLALVGLPELLRNRYPLFLAAIKLPHFRASRFWLMSAKRTQIFRKSFFHNWRQNDLCKPFFSIPSRILASAFYSVWGAILFAVLLGKVAHLSNTYYFRKQQKERVGATFIIFLKPMKGNGSAMICGGVGNR